MAIFYLLYDTCLSLSFSYLWEEVFTSTPRQIFIENPVWLQICLANDIKLFLLTKKILTFLFPSNTDSMTRILLIHMNQGLCLYFGGGSNFKSAFRETNRVKNLINEFSALTPWKSIKLKDHDQLQRSYKEIFACLLINVVKFLMVNKDKP